MTRAEQARLSEDRYGQGASAQAPRSRDAHAGRHSGSQAANSRDAASRTNGVEAYAVRRKKKGHGHVLRGVLISLAVILVGVGVAAGVYLTDINSRLSAGVSESLRQQLVSVEPQEPFYMLLLGVDKSDERAEDWGSDTSNFRSDTIILARVDPPNQSITLVSIPRDTMVDMGDHGKQKINAAYSYGGASYMTQVVSQFAGVNISHYAEIDFEQFTSIVDTIGGIEVTLPVAVSDMDYAGIDLPAGTQTLDGEEALGLVRSRHAYDAYGAGDFYRSANQRMVIGSIVKKVLQLDAASMTSTVSQLASSVTTDFNVTDILSLAAQFKDLDVDNNVYSGLVPTNSQYIDSLWYEVVDESAWKTMMQRVNNGESPYADESEDPTAGVAGSVGTTSSDSSTSSVTASFTGSVTVLNGTGTSGLAQNMASTLVNAGFSATAKNASSSDIAETAILYNSSRTGAQAAALGVAQTLGIDEGAVTTNDGTYSTSTDVVVVLGADQVDD